MEVTLNEFRFDDRTAATCRFATTPLASQRLLAGLVVTFTGIADHDPARASTFRFLRAMVLAGLEGCDPRPLGLVLDLRQLDYAGGDRMADVLTAGARWGGAGFPTAVGASQRGRAGRPADAGGGLVPDGLVVPDPGGCSSGGGPEGPAARWIEPLHLRGRAVAASNRWRAAVVADRRRPA
jgi:hypothetical protein